MYWRKFVIQIKVAVASQSLSYYQPLHFNEPSFPFYIVPSARYQSRKVALEIGLGIRRFGFS